MRKREGIQMTRAIMVRSIPLHIDTRNAWKYAGATFARRDRTTPEIVMLARGRPIINLGSSGFEHQGAWNSAPTVSNLLSPKQSREVWGGMMPPDSAGYGTYWIKGAGRGGANKEKVWVNNQNDMTDLRRRADWIDGDIQLHIDGTEYRVITVKDQVVQVSQRLGENGDRNYRWLGTRGAPRGLVPAAKWAAAKFTERTIIGWDLIKSDDTGEVFILEGNACPGVNEATAGRILDAVEDD